MTEKENIKGPSEGGMHKAYYPEYKNLDDVWKPIPIQQVEHGVKLWPCHGNAGDIVGLMGYDAAMAIAYTWKASRVEGWLSVRVVEYQLDYSITTEFVRYHDIPTMMEEYVITVATPKDEEDKK